MEEKKTYPVKETPVLLTIIFDFLTGGIYSCVWFLSRREGLNKLSGNKRYSTKMGEGVFIVCLLMLLFNFIIWFLVGSGNLQEDSEVVVWTVPIYFIAGMTLIVQSFKAKGILEKRLKTRSRFSPLPNSLSGGATFFFRIYYLQYAINRFHKGTTRQKEAKPIDPPETTQKMPDEENTPCNAVKNYAQLMKLKTLHKEGILTEEEYLAEKKKLI